MSSSPLQHPDHAQAGLGQGQLQAAIDQWQALRSRDPDGVHTRLLAAQIAWHRGQIGEAADQALAATERGETDPAVVVDLIAVLQQVGETARAHAVFEQTDWCGVGAVNLLYRHAIQCQAFGEYERALTVFDRLLTGAPGHGLLLFLRAQQLEFLGRLVDAGQAYEICLAASPDMGYAAYKLARLRPRGESESLLRMVESRMPSAQPGTSGRADFEFARYHLLENLGRVDEAWLALQSANADMYALNGVDVGMQETGLRHSCTYMSEQTIVGTSTMPAGPCPIFIVGMPRSGTTLLERMLANHSQVTGAGELIDFGGQMLRVLGHRDLFGVRGISAMTTSDFAELGRRYLAQTAWRAAGRAYFVDKQPANWMSIGLLHAALPQAKILHMVRDPMDTCFSIWRARFADAHEWSYRQDVLARHFDSYQFLMSHWKQVCPQAILDVDYAALVSDPAATLREVLTFCGLAWEPGCEDPSRNRAPVATLSSSQAREPVNMRGVGHWQRYARQMEPLRRQVLQS